MTPENRNALAQIVRAALEQHGEEHVTEAIEAAHWGKSNAYTRGIVNGDNRHLFRQYRNHVTPSAVAMIAEARQLVARVYRFHVDPGHGWLEVPAAELEALGIAGQISGYSYLHEGRAYLEEDCDLARFMEALKARGERPTFETVNHAGDWPGRQWGRYPGRR